VWAHHIVVHIEIFPIIWRLCYLKIFWSPKWHDEHLKFLERLLLIWSLVLSLRMGFHFGIHASNWKGWEMCVDNVFHFIKLYTTSHTCVWHYFKCNCLWTLIHPKNKTLNCYQPWLLYEYWKLIIYISMFLVFLHSSWIIARQFSLKKWMLFNFKLDEIFF